MMRSADDLCSLFSSPIWVVDCMCHLAALITKVNKASQTLAILNKAKQVDSCVSRISHPEWRESISLQSCGVRSA